MWICNTDGRLTCTQSYSLKVSQEKLFSRRISVSDRKDNIKTGITQAVFENVGSYSL